jgi:nicotinate-nucleotide adenylyltransferase
MKDRIGLFGGTFDPIHNGHIRAALDVRRAFGLDRVLFVPSHRPPHKQAGPGASPADRLRMVELACEGHPGFVASSLEVEAGGRSYSFLTLARIKERFPGAEVLFILGVDAFLEIGTWREHERVLDECRFIVTGRPGFDLEAAADVLNGRLRPDIRRVGDGGPVDEALLTRYRVFLLPIAALDMSSTDVRERIRRGESPAGLVPPSVETYISDHQLYLDRRGS